MENSESPTNKKRQMKDKLVREGVARRRDEVSIENIVYLDEDIHSYKYFLTGKFDEDARKKYILEQNAANVKMEDTHRTDTSDEQKSDQRS